MADKNWQIINKKEIEVNQVLKLSQIIQRQKDTRIINLNHVKALAESIRYLGLLEPLVLDNKNYLLAGKHRLAAIKLLREQDIQAYQNHFPNELIQVRKMSFSAQLEPDLALKIEVAENEYRRDYTPSEVRALVDLLQNQGYKLLKGRPKKGEKSLVLELAFIINKSKRTVERYLNEKNIDITQQSATYVALCQEKNALKNTYKNLKSWENILTYDLDTPKRQRLSKKIHSILHLIDETIAEINVILLDNI